MPYVCREFSSISIVPAKVSVKMKIVDTYLYAANSTNIFTYGTKLMDLDLGFTEGASDGHSP